MMETLIIIIIIILSVLCLCVCMKCITDLNKRIVELEKKIDNIQYQNEDVLCDINIVNENVLNTYGLLGRMKDENKNN